MILNSDQTQLPRRTGQVKLADPGFEGGQPGTLFMCQDPIRLLLAPANLRGVVDMSHLEATFI